MSKAAVPIPLLTVAGLTVRSLTRDQDVSVSVSASISAACAVNSSLSFRWEQVNTLPAGDDFVGILLSSEVVRWLHRVNCLNTCTRPDRA